MSSKEEKLATSKARMNKAVETILSADSNFTGQITLDIHIKDGIIRDVYEIKSRRKV